jgi:hypothetical protein
MKAHWLPLALVFLFGGQICSAQIVFDQDRYAYNFDKCISFGNLKKATLSQKYKLTLSTLGVFRVSGEILQVDTAADFILMLGVAYYAGEPIDSIEVRAITKVNQKCSGLKCKYAVNRLVYSVSNVNGLFILALPKEVPVDGLIFSDLRGHIKELNAMFFSACDEPQEL